MHDQFADWFRVVSIQPKDVDLSARWSAIEAFGAEARSLDFLDAARLFYRLQPKDPEFLPRFRHAFKTADSTFSMLDNNAELQVLAGALLADFLSKEGEIAAAAALAITCGGFRGRRSPPVGDIHRLAAEYLAAASAALREPSVESLPEHDLGPAITAAKEALKANGAVQTLASPIGQVLTDLETVTSNLSDWARDQDRQQAMRLEESNVLWWLLGGHSRDLQIPFSKLKPPAVPLLAGKELADLAQTVPGPYGARAFLDKILRDAHGAKVKSHTLAEAVAACPIAWQKAVSKDSILDRIDDLVPTRLALRKASELDGDKAWVTVFERASGLKASDSMDPLDLAQQAYEEWLLETAIRDLEE